MRILFVSFQHPWPGDVGGRQRVLNLSRELAGRHEVTLVSLLPTDSPDRLGWESFAAATYARVIETDCRTWQPPERPVRSKWSARKSNLSRLLLNRWPRQVQNWTVPRAIEFFSELKAEVPHDVAWIDKAYIAMQARTAGLPRIIVDLMELESVNMRRAGAALNRKRCLFRWLEYQKLHRFERRLPKRFWRVAVCSPNDRAFFGRASNVYVVPNGINEVSSPNVIHEQEGNLLFVGAMDYMPNVDAVKGFVRDVLPAILGNNPSTTFNVVGQSPGEEIQNFHDGERIVVHGRVPEVGEYYQRACVVVAPIRLGSGTRLKVLEALNWSKALVATKTAVEGLDLRPGVDFIQADTESEMAVACSRLLHDPQERRRLGMRGQEHVRRKFSWRAIGNAVDAAVSF